MIRHKCPKIHMQPLKLEVCSTIWAKIGGINHGNIIQDSFTRPKYFALFHFEEGSPFAINFSLHNLKD